MKPLFGALHESGIAHRDILHRRTTSVVNGAQRKSTGSHL